MRIETVSPQQFDILHRTLLDAELHRIHDVYRLRDSNNGAEFMKILNANELPAQEVDRLLIEQEQQFLTQAKETPALTNGQKRQRKKTLSPQR